MLKKSKHYQNIVINIGTFKFMAQYFVMPIKSLKTQNATNSISNNDL